MFRYIQGLVASKNWRFVSSQPRSCQLFLKIIRSNHRSAHRCYARTTAQANHLLSDVHRFSPTLSDNCYITPIPPWRRFVTVNAMLTSRGRSIIKSVVCSGHSKQKMHFDLHENLVRDNYTRESTYPRDKIHTKKQLSQNLNFLPSVEKIKQQQ